jgi:hypothetical protein
MVSQYIHLYVQNLTRDLNIGDSLYHKHNEFPTITTVVKMLRWWLELRWQGHFSFVGCKLEHGNQHDTFSCAFTTINMLAHEALEEPLWNTSQQATYRIRWFNRLIDEGRIMSNNMAVDVEVSKRFFQRQS